MNEFYAVIEAGGTKFNCAIMDTERRIHKEKRIATTTPSETLEQTVDFFRDCKTQGFLFAKMGIGSFGPLDLDTSSATYGYITATPKPYWTDTPILEYLATALQCEICIDTDVNAAALGESRWGAAKNCKVAVYVTVGTGVGGGVIINGQPLHGLVHPEIGHMLIGDIDGTKGVCPFHGSCVEGLASGTSLGKIWKAPSESLAAEHQAWDVEAQAIAKLCHNLLVSYSAEKIVLGGGVMQQDFLLPKIHQYALESLNGYIRFPKGITIDNIIVPPGLGCQSGLHGALALVLEDE